MYASGWDILYRLYLLGRFVGWRSIAPSVGRSVGRNVGLRKTFTAISATENGYVFFFLSAFNAEMALTDPKSTFAVT